MKITFVGVVVLLAAWPSFAQGTSDGGVAPVPESQEARINALEHKVEVLSEELESQRMNGASATATNGAAAPAPASDRLGMSPAAAKVYDVQGGLSIGGYGETVFTAYAQHLESGLRAPIDNMTDELRGVVYVGYKFNNWLVFDSELEWEHGGFSDEHHEGEAIAEFAFVDFLINKAINIRAGQVLLPVGFLNELHEPPIFLGALRPQLEQESGLIPSTWHENGVGIHGELPFNLSYKLYVVNGLNAANFNGDGTGTIGTGRQDGHLAIANQPAVTGRLDWFVVPGALLGASFYTGNSAQTRGATAVWTTLFDVHGEFRTHGLQLRAIYAHMNNSTDGIAAAGVNSPAFLTGTTQSGGYVEAGYDVLTFLNLSKQSLIPFVRYERYDLQQDVAPGAAATGESNVTAVEVGFNYKPIPQVAVKADYDINTNAASTGRNQFNLALGYLF